MKTNNVFKRILYMLPLIGLIFASGCSSKNNATDNKYNDSQIQSIVLDGVMQKSSYSSYDTEWDLDGIQLRLKYNDNNEELIPLENKKTTFELYPESPFRLANDEIRLEVKNVKYYSDDGRVFDIDYMLFTVEINHLSEDDYTISVIVNLLAAITIITMVIAIIVLLKEDKFKHE